MDAIRKVMQAESDGREQRSAAEAQAKQLVADADRDGRALMERMRQLAAESGKELLERAEKNAAEKAAAIGRETEAAGEQLRRTAKGRMEDAAATIVARVVGE